MPSARLDYTLESGLLVPVPYMNANTSESMWVVHSNTGV